MSVLCPFQGGCISAINSAPVAVGSHDYEVLVSNETIDPVWDAFLQSVGGEYPQTGMWARVKSGSGYETRRIIVKRSGAIVAGAQLLLRLLPVAGKIGYVPLGPVLISEDRAIAKILVDQIRQLAKKEQLRFVAAQAPPNSPSVADALRDGCFSVWSPRLARTASILIDLSRDLSDILAQMSATTRKHIRRGERGQVIVRQGTHLDLATFHRLACTTAQRRGFDIPNVDYLSKVWSAFAPNGSIKIFVSEMAGEALSALLVIAFGNTVSCWRMGWAGRQVGLYPNESMHWAAIQWAKSQGYRSFDMGGMHLDLARVILAGGNTHAMPEYRVDYFKLGFGGKVTLFPEPFSYVHNPLLRSAWPLLTVAMTRFGKVRRLMLNRFTGRA